MKKKDILELKKRFKKDHCTFTKVCGCYVNGEKNTILKFRETFLNLDEDDYFKYLEIAKKVLSGTVGNNILELNFLANEEFKSEAQTSLLTLRNTQLKDDTVLDEFYQSIINNYDYTGNYLILLFHDAYDVITKTKDNQKIDESEEVYEYVLCAICPVSLSAPGLRYFEEENEIKSRIRDWVVNPPVNGFVFPAFIDRSSDVNSVMYYTKNAKDTHPELMENVLGCPSKQTATIQKEAFQSIIKDSFGADEKKAEKIFMDVQENLNAMVEEYNEMYDDTDCEPISLKDTDIQNLLIDSGIPQEISNDIEKSYVEIFGDDIPLAENLIDAKILKANEQRRKEEDLKKQVKMLETKLEEVQKEVAISNKSEETTENDDTTSEYDVVLQVKPEKVSQIKSQIIDGQKYLVIPINDDEHTKVNDLDDLI
ncbi:DUF4317 domain-containing protein [Clostridium sp.]|uniref:DUF4317 domain-containing protein n=1 Tax=Clostridium sp. TaxID=1506 RepID=UPI002A9154BD|nr:DUF4317 domain-containing protein [Clostridium sp.]MDY6012561.1 DUF4317 domain-containing protein [Clostridium sp.]